MGKKEFYKQTSTFTELGKYKEDAVDLWENKCNKSLKNLCHYIMNISVHPIIIQWALEGRDVHEYGDFSFIDYTTPMREDDIFLTATSIFAEIFRRDKKGFYIGRPAKNRLIISCRYVSVLTSAILKANNIACRSRAGWARYLEKGKILDHWVNEYWNEQESRWVMFDIDDLYDEDWLKDEFYKENKICKEYLDFGKEQFYTAAEMWKMYRLNPKIVETLKYGSGISKPEEIIKYLFLDFWSVMNQEYNYKFSPLFFDKKVDDLSISELKDIDNLAELMCSVDKNFDKLQKMYKIPKYRLSTSPLVGEEDYSLLIKEKNYNF